MGLITCIVIHSTPECYLLIIWSGLELTHAYGVLPTSKNHAWKRKVRRAAFRWSEPATRKISSISVKTRSEPVVRIITKRSYPTLWYGMTTLKFNAHSCQFVLKAPTSNTNEKQIFVTLLLLYLFWSKSFIYEQTWMGMETCLRCFW